MTPTNPLSDTGLNYLALGDSYTIGESVGENERFPYYLAALLGSVGMPVKTPRYIARTGWSTIALQNAIESNEPLGTYDFVTLLIGVNDQYQRLDTAGYRIRFQQLLNKAVQLANNKPSRVFVLSIPDYSATPFVGTTDKDRVRKEVDAFNNINKQITLQQNIAYIDITPESRRVAVDPTLLANDGLHYSGKEHMIWAELAVAEIRKALK